MNLNSKEVKIVSGGLVLVGGLAHIAPAAFAGIVAFGAGPVTVQLIAGVAGLLVGLGMLMKKQG